MNVTVARSTSAERAMHFREVLFLLVTGIFITALTLGNIVGITKFIDLRVVQIPAGLLGYRITLLVTDLISEMYGRKRAQAVVCGVPSQRVEWP